MLSAELFQFVVELISLSRSVHLQIELEQLGEHHPGAVRWRAAARAGRAGVGSGGCAADGGSGWGQQEPQAGQADCHDISNLLSPPPPGPQARLRDLLSRPLCGLQLVLVGDFLQVGWVTHVFEMQQLAPLHMPCRCSARMPSMLARMRPPCTGAAGVLALSVPAAAIRIPAWASAPSTLDWNASAPAAAAAGGQGAGGLPEGG